MTVRWQLYAWLALTLAATATASGAWMYGKGRAAVQRDWNAAKAAAVLAGAKDQVEAVKIGDTLQEQLDANRDNQPVIAVVPERVCPEPRVSAAARAPRAPARASPSPEAAALGEAIAHDARSYPDCVSSLDAAQAALKLCSRDARDARY